MFSVSSYRLTVQLLLLLSFIICTTAAPHHIRHSGHRGRQSSSSQSSLESLTSSRTHSFDPYSPCSGEGGGGDAKPRKMKHLRRSLRSRDMPEIKEQTLVNMHETKHHAQRIRRQTIDLKVKYVSITLFILVHNNTPDVTYLLSLSPCTFTTSTGPAFSS